MEPETTPWFNNSANASPAELPATRSEMASTGLRGPDDTEPAGDPPILQVGHSIGKYEIRQRLGQGGQGQAFLAYDPDLRRDVVIKFYHAVKDPADRETVLNEGRALARVRSPFVAQCYGADRHDGVPYLVLEYVPGATLGDLSASRRLDVARVLQLVGQIAEGLAAIHACGILHLDLKPSNILVGDDDRPRIVDFGLATTIGSERLRKISGTPAYMAPEQARGDFDRIDARADVFGLGAVLYELLTGQPPYQGESQLSIWSQAKVGDVIPAVQREPKLAAAVNDLCMRCLAKDPAARWRSADDLCARLADLDQRQRKGFGFLLQLGRFKLQLSIGISLASLLLIVGAVSWMQSDARRPQQGPVAMGDLRGAPGGVEENEFKRGPMNEQPTVELRLGGAPDPALPSFSGKQLPSGLSEAQAPASAKSSIPSNREALRDHAYSLRKAASARRDFVFDVKPLAPSRQRGETIVVPFGESLRLELSTDHHCVAGLWLRHADGAVEQLLPSEHDTDSQMKPHVTRQIPPRRIAGQAELAADVRAPGSLDNKGVRYRLPELEAGELAHLYVVARSRPLSAEFQPAKAFVRWIDGPDQRRWEQEILALVTEEASDKQAKIEVVELVIPVQAEARP